MKYTISAGTDAGNIRKVNQDGVVVQRIATRTGEAVLAVLCDGVGGLREGEAASAMAVSGFGRGMRELFGKSCGEAFSDAIKREWQRIIDEVNMEVYMYGKRKGIRLGTTLTSVILAEGYYYIINVGDSRVYHIREGVTQLTTDHTYGSSGMLLQCIGGGKKIQPDMFTGKVFENSVYLLCSDGFRNRVGSEEMKALLSPDILSSGNIIRKNIRKLIDLNKERRETDNITAAVIKVGR